MPTCTICKLIKDDRLFQPDSRRKDGFHPWCKPCKMIRKNEAKILRADLPDHTLAQRLWAKVIKLGPDDCWEWQGYKTRDGYGCIQAHGRAQTVHRVALELDGRPADPEQYVDHLCRNRGCVNVRHLRAVTPAVNTLENSLGMSAINAQKTNCKCGEPFRFRYDTGRGKVRLCGVCRPINPSNPRVSQIAP